MFERAVAAATLGRARESAQVAALLGLTFDVIDALPAVSWTLVRQGLAAQLSREIWMSGLAGRISSDVLELCSRATDLSSIDCPVVRSSSNCVAFVLPGFDEFGYYVGVENSRESVPELVQAEALLRQGGDWSWISEFVGCLVLIDADDRGPHRSYSLRQTPGTIYTQPFLHENHAAVTIIHEAAHTVFNLALSGLGILDRLLQHTDLYHSPWRKQFRPAFGLLHAAFAFGTIEVFHSRTGHASYDVGVVDGVNRHSLLASKCDVLKIAAALESDALENLFAEVYARLG